MSLTEIHGALSRTAILLTFILAIWGYFRFFRKEGVSSSYWGAMVIAEILYIVQGVIFWCSTAPRFATLIATGPGGPGRQHAAEPRPTLTLTTPGTSMAAAEPTTAALRNPLRRYFLTTRPAFLLASLAPCFIGFATAHWSGVTLHLELALATLLGAALVHAGINVLNDYYDALNGTDELNTERLFPFTGGSRFIQNGVLSTGQTARYGALLLAAGGAIGVALALAAGPLLWLIGLTGVLLGWAYSAPPLSLNSRGLRELSVALGFGILIPFGADYVQRGAFELLPIAAGVPYALLVANLLYIDQFPDRRADDAAGKHHWVVRLGARRARWGYAAAAFAAYAILAMDAPISQRCQCGWLQCDGDANTTLSYRICNGSCKHDPGSKPGHLSHHKAERPQKTYVYPASLSQSLCSYYFHCTLLVIRFF